MTAPCAHLPVATLPKRGDDQPRRGQPARFDYLDAMRGVAALMVVLHHCYQTSPVWPAFVRVSPLRILLNGRASVIFFFVLSGFVLACGLWRNGADTSLIGFMQRRLARIYLPFCAAACIAIFAMVALQPHVLPDTAITFNEMWRAPVDGVTALAHLAMLGTDAANSVNTPAWSLVYELRISLVMPLLCLIGAAAAPLLASVSVMAYVGVGLLMASRGLPAVPYGAENPLDALLVTVHFAAFFVIGLLLARAALRGAPWLTGMRMPLKAALGVAGIVLSLIFRDETAALGASAFIVLALNTPRLQAFLRQPLMLWLGKISFSLYLTHAIVLQLVVRALEGAVPLRLSVLLALAAMFPVAVLFYAWIERPAHLLSRRVGRLQVRQAAPVAPLQQDAIRP